MKLTILTAVEILLFNICIILAFQPRFIFKFLNIDVKYEKKIRLLMTGLAVFFICVLFCWSFLFGSILFLYTQSLIYN